MRPKHFFYQTFPRKSVLYVMHEKGWANRKGRVQPLEFRNGQPGGTSVPLDCVSSPNRGSWRNPEIDFMMSKNEWKELILQIHNQYWIESGDISSLIVVRSKSIDHIEIVP
jgi:hypothetical protein